MLHFDMSLAIAFFGEEAVNALAQCFAMRRAILFSYYERLRDFATEVCEVEVEAEVMAALERNLVTGPTNHLC